jgi:mitofilin
MLDADEVSNLQQALYEQSEMFLVMLSDMKEEADQLVESKVQTVQKEMSEQLEASRAEWSLACQNELAERLSLQADEFREQLRRDLARQEEDLNALWNQRIKQRVDEERAGRLARLDQLALTLKYLEQLSVESGAYVNRAHRIHTGLTKVKAIVARLEKGQRDVSKDIAALKKLAHGDPVITQVLDRLSTKSKANLTSKLELSNSFWGLQNDIRRVQLLPDQAGPISYFLSKWLSYLYIPKVGLVPGQDVEAVLARASYYLNQSNLDAAAREINQLTGWTGHVSREWLDKARNYLELEQALDVIETHLHLQSLGVVE